MKLLIFLLASACLALAQTPAPSKAATPPAKAAAPATKTGTSGGSASSTSRLLNPAALTAKAPEVFRAKFTTSKGDFVVEVTRAWAPLGADRFYNLVRNHFFDNAPFFRAIANFMVQFGLPANPAYGKVWAKAAIKDDPVKQSNKKGTITFATAGPNTRTTQVFINLVDNGTTGAQLDGQGFAPFGTVTEGMEVVSSFYTGYGDSGPDQGRLTDEGKAYADKSFPRLDSIKTATIIFPEPPPPPPPAAKKAAPAAGTVPKAPATAPTGTKAPAAPPKKQ
jgi:peptidyl-prolyl cis-trans isomerase A (cyclophilin A)